MVDQRVAIGPTRRGMVLVSALFAVVAITALLATVQLTAREHLRIALNTNERLRLEWEAEGCVATIKASMSLALRDSLNGASAPDVAWRHLDERVRLMVTPSSPCRWRVFPAGTHLNVNDAGEHTLLAALSRTGLGGGRLHIAVASILDWIDADDVPRDGGAESDWYRAARRIPPRNGPLEDIAELQLVRGLEGVSSLTALLSTVAEPIDVVHAPIDVMRLVPGMPDQLVARVVDLRERGQAIPELEQLALGLVGGAREELQVNLATLRTQFAREPFAWIIDVSVANGAAGPGVHIRQRVTRSGVRVAVQREVREWL